MEGRQTIERCSQSIFRSVSELSSNGEKTSGLAIVDMVYFVSSCSFFILLLHSSMNKYQLKKLTKKAFLKFIICSSK